MDIAYLIRYRRRQKGLKQKELARSIGISANTMCSIESGRSQPTIKTLESIFDALDLYLVAIPSEGMNLLR